MLPRISEKMFDGKLKEIAAELNGYIKPPVAETVNLNSVVIDLTRVTNLTERLKEQFQDRG